MTVYKNNGATVTYAGSMLTQSTIGAGFTNQLLPVGNYTLGPAIAITGVTQASPGVITAPSHGLSNGDFIYVNLVSGMTSLNDNLYQIHNAAANSFTLVDVNGTAVDTTGYAPYTSAGSLYKLTQVGTVAAGPGYSTSPDGRTIIEPGI